MPQANASITIARRVVVLDGDQAGQRAVAVTVRLTTAIGKTSVSHHAQAASSGMFARNAIAAASSPINTAAQILWLI